jgi:hypothetical protein
MSVASIRPDVHDGKLGSVRTACAELRQHVQIAEEIARRSRCTVEGRLPVLVADLRVGAVRDERLDVARVPARRNGVSPSRSRAFTSAPWASSSPTESEWSHRELTAWCSGVCPQLSCAFTLAW